MTPPRLHLIGNAHIDPVWLWQWPEGYHEVHATFRSALDRLTEYAEFLFVSSSAQFYQWIEQGDPAMFAEIKARVAEGRWEIVGGWWIQPDCNLPGGEAFVRQGLYAQRYFQEKFGVTASVGYNPDSFGHAASLPQILLKSGLRNYVFMRPSPQEKGLPARLFWWESDDGSRVLTHRIPFEYGTWGKELDIHVGRSAAEVRPPVPALMCFYGVGNHGGGPTRANLDSLRRLRAAGEAGELVFSTPNRYFAEMRAAAPDLPVVHDELQNHATGCYAAHSGVKRWNRQAEQRLLAAEKWSAVAAQVLGRAYPRAELTGAWQRVLFNQFHDILAGTSLEAAYEDARDSYGEALAVAGRALYQALHALAWNIHIVPEEGARPLVVFNPHAWATRCPVALEVSRVRPGEALFDASGAPVPFQIVQSAATAGGRERLCFVADLPALGYAVYHIAARPAPEGAQPAASAAAEATAAPVLENARLRLEFDPATGCLISLRDKRLDLEVLAGPAARPVVLRDHSDTWSHNVFAYLDVEGEFAAESVRLIESGPVRSTLRVVSSYGASRLVQDFSLYHASDRVDVAVTVDWHAQFRLLKLRFPVHVHYHKITYELPYGVLERGGNGEEEPGQSWLDVSGTARTAGVPYGLSVLNDGKYSFDVNVRDIGLTVLRSPIYAHHDPAVPAPDAEYSFIDQGRQQFTYSLLPHASSWEQAATVRAAAELNQPPVALLATSHPGALPPRHSFAALESDTAVLTVLKQAEDSDDLIVRAYDPTRAGGAATLRLPAWNREVPLTLAPAEIKTVRVPRDPAQPASETNLLEWLPTA